MKLSTSLVKSFICAAVVGLSFGCGEDDDKKSTEDAASFGGFEYTVKSGELDTSADGQISGTGQMLMSTPIASEAGGEVNVGLQFTLEDGGNLRLYAFAGANLEGGLNFQFTRSGTDLTLAMSQGGQDTSFAFTGIDASETINFRIDIHNGEGEDGHILMWNVAPDAGLEGVETVVDTEETDKGVSPGKGQGTGWGIELTNATLTGLTLGDAENEEE